jgi:hypothetical protein
MSLVRVVLSRIVLYLGLCCGLASTATAQPEAIPSSSIRIGIARSTAEATVERHEQGVIRVCIHPEELCFGNAPFDIQAELSRPSFLTGDMTGLVVRSWNLSAIRPLELTIRGTPCADTDFCEVGTGYLLLLERPGGELVAGRMVRGDDYSPEPTRVVSGPIGAYPSTL